jgi:hypothetical protein
MGQKSYPASGSRGAIHIGEQQLLTVAVQPSHKIAFVSESLVNAENELQSAGIEGDRALHKLIRNTFDVNGDINIELAAAGFGMLMRHLLGDYVKTNRVDGAIRGRMQRSAVDQTTNVDATGVKYILELSPETSANFEAAGGTFAVVRRNATNTLIVEDNTAAGWEYDSFNPAEITNISAIVASDTTHSGATTPVVRILLPDAVGFDGVSVAPEANPNGGILYYGSTRRRVRYFEAAPAVGGTYVYLDPADVPAGNVTAGQVVAVGEVVVLAPCLTALAAYTGASVVKGNWAYAFTAGTPLAGVWMHHLEPGVRLPPAGLTVEVDRDAAIFIYSGLKVGQAQFTFDASAIVTATYSFMGIRENGITRLVDDVIPGATSVNIVNGLGFKASGGQFTIGEETALVYTGKTNNADGTATLTGVSTVIRTHVKGSNVDPRSSRKASTVYSNIGLTPLISFETLVRIDGYAEEVLNASLTINNNVNGDKFGLGSRERFGLVEGMRMVEGTLNLEFDDGKNYERYTSGDYFSVEFRSIMESADAEIGESGVLNSATFFCPRCKFNGTTPNVSDQEFLQHEMPFRAVWDDAYNTPEVVVQMTNGFEFDVSPAVASSSLAST